MPRLAPVTKALPPAVMAPAIARGPVCEKRLIARSGRGRVRKQIGKQAASRTLPAPYPPVAEPLGGALLRAAGTDAKPIQQLMGHSSSQITLDIYVHPQDDALLDTEDGLDG